MTAVRSERYITTRRSILAAVAGGGLGALVAACTATPRIAAGSGEGGGGGAGETGRESTVGDGRARFTDGAERFVLPAAPGPVGADERNAAVRNAKRVA
jgi:hypothetical protein